MKVYLQYPWRYSDSPYYKYLTTNPHDGIEYLNINQAKGVITSQKKFSVMAKIKDILRAMLKVVKLPNIALTIGKEYDLIHCCHCLSLNKNPWVVDVEHYWNFASSGEISYSDKGKKRIKKFLKNSDCKKILAWSEDCKNTIIEAMNDKEIDDKIEVLYPALKVQNNLKVFNNDINILFVGRYFYGKGGHHALKVFNRLTQLFPTITCTVVSDVPEQIKEKYLDNKQLKIYDIMPQEKLFKLFEKASIFFYPGYSDTFGFALLEAMSFGLPIVTAEGFAKAEIVEAGRTGVIVPTGEIDWINGRPVFKDELTLLKSFVNELSSLIRLKHIRNQMGEQAYNEIDYGKFSIAKRNQKLIRIYEEANK